MLRETPDFSVPQLPIYAVSLVYMYDFPNTGVSLTMLILNTSRSYRSYDLKQGIQLSLLQTGKETHLASELGSKKTSAGIEVKKQECLQTLSSHHAMYI